MPKNKAINLLPQKEFETSVTGRVLKWATSTFRVIVVVTEMVVMAAFLSRFWLDAQNSDLNDAIKTKSAQISAQKKTEDSFRSLQKKLNITKQIRSTPLPTEKIDLIASRIPPDVSLSTVSITESSVQVQGLSSSELGIAQFVSNLKAETSFKDVDLGQIGSSEKKPSFVIFGVKINLK